MTTGVSTSELDGLGVAKDVGDPFRGVVADCNDGLADSPPSRFGKLTFLVNPLLYPLLPFLNRSTVQQRDDDDSHVVTSDTTQLRIRCQTLQHQILTDLWQSVAIGDSTTDKVDNLLRGETIPDTVTSQDEELFFSVTLVRNDFGVGGDDLVFGVQRVVLLELEITDSPGKGEVTCGR